MKAKFNGNTLSVYDGNSHLLDETINSDIQEIELNVQEKLVFNRDGDDIVLEYFKDQEFQSNVKIIYI